MFNTLLGNPVQNSMLMEVTESVLRDPLPSPNCIPFKHEQSAILQSQTAAGRLPPNPGPFSLVLLISLCNCILGKWLAAAAF